MKCLAFDYLIKAENIEQYNARFSASAQESQEGMSDPQKEMLGYYQLNWARSSRVEKTYQVSAHASEKLDSMTSKQYWFVITEGWCGDSSQSLPVIAELARASHGLIDLRIISRDAYPELLEHYLTNGSMSIPKLIACSEAGEELWIWGPRPEAGTLLFNELKSQGLPKEEIYKSLHVWYAKDKGVSIEEELINHLS